MADKFYHQQPCFCIPCRVMKADGVKRRPVSEEPDLPKKKAKRSKRV